MKKNLIYEDEIKGNKLTENHVSTAKYRSSSFRITDFPPEILLYIFSFLNSPKDLVSLSKTNKQLRLFAFNKGLWQSFQKQRFNYPRIINISHSVGRNAKIVIKPDGCVIISDKVKPPRVNGLIRIWDERAGKCSKILRGHKGTITALSIDNNGNLISGDHLGSVRIWDAATWKCLKVFKVKPTWYFAPDVNCFLSLSNGRLLCGHLNGTITLLETKIGGIYPTHSRYFNPPNRGLKVSALVSLTSTLIASAYYGNPKLTKRERCSIWIWDIPRWKYMKELKGHNDNVHSLLRLSNGRLVSGSSDSTCRIWDIKSGKCLQVLKLKKYYFSTINTLSLTSEGHLVSGGSDGSFYIWDIIKSEFLLKMSLDIKIIYSRTLVNGSLCICGIDNDDNIRIFKYPPKLPESLLKEEKDISHKQSQYCLLQ